MGLADEDDDEDLAAVPPPGGFSVGAVCRLVKKASSKAFNRAASAASDADAVARILDGDENNDLGLSSLPVFANARAGLWHVDLLLRRRRKRNSSGNGDFVQQCRFKSTDGHAAAAAGRGCFPLSRLNLGVAAAAAAAVASCASGGRGGAVVVDATRKGKRFPDALSRTIPTWAAVVNRACVIWIEEEEREGGKNNKDDDDDDDENEPSSFFCSPPWVPASERSQIESRIEGWARLLLSTGVDLSSFAAELAERPLEPVWLSRKGGEGGGETGMLFASSVDVVRSEEGAKRERRKHGKENTTTTSTTTTTPLYLFSASDPSARRATVSCGCDWQAEEGETNRYLSHPTQSDNSSRTDDDDDDAVAAADDDNDENGCGRRSRSPCRPHQTHPCFALSFDYEAGGGDDEEGWSGGLSARTFWQHRGELLSKGPGGFEEAVRKLAGRKGEARAPSPSAPSFSFVCGTRLAVGNAAAAAAASRSSPLFEGGPPAVVTLGAGDKGENVPSSPASSLCFRAAVPRRKKLALLEALPSVVAFASAHLREGRAVLFASGEEGEAEDESSNENAAAAAAAVLLACFSAPPRAHFARAFFGGGVRGGASTALGLGLLRPCGCPAPPRASREEVRARVAAVCGSAAAAAAASSSLSSSSSSSSPSPPLPLSVGKEAAKQLLMFVSPPQRPGRGFQCPACRAGRPARLGWERASSRVGKGKEATETPAPTPVVVGVEVEA